MTADCDYTLQGTCSEISHENNVTDILIVDVYAVDKNSCVV